MPDQSAARLRTRLCLLGRWQLGGDWPVDGARDGVGDTARRLLALIALRGPMSRPQIAGTLWPEITESAASGRLRTVLWRFGRLRGLLDERNGSISLSTSVSVDVHDLRAGALSLDLELALGDPLCVTDPVGVAAFELDLLPGWYDDWLVVDRERIRQLRLHALEALATRRMRVGQYAAALDSALAAVRADPLRESAQRCVISAHLAEGNVGEAVRQFETYRAVLALELRIEPSPSLLAMLPATLER